MTKEKTGIVAFTIHKLAFLDNISVNLSVQKFTDDWLILITR